MLTRRVPLGADPLAAREVALERRRQQRRADEARMVKLEPLSGGGVGIAARPWP